MPGVRLVSVRRDTASPGPPTSAITIGADGTLLFKNLPGDEHPLLLVPAGDSLPQPLSRRGAGPGEIVAAFPLTVTDSSEIVWDAGTLRLSEWSRRGALVRSLKPRTGISPVAWAPGRGIIGTNERRQGPEVLLMAADAERIERLLAPEDSAYQSILPPERDYSDRLRNYPAIGAWRGGVMLANGRDYRIGLFDWTGRPVWMLSRALGANHRGAETIARELADQRAAGRIRNAADADRLQHSLADEPVNWFGHLVGPAEDASGRIWVVGTAGDSTFADVFGPPRFLGRIYLPCAGFRGRWSLNGTWLAVMCEPDPGDEASDGVLKVFRIVDGGARDS